MKIGGKEVLLKKIDFKGGQVDIRSNIDASLSIKDQILELKEDIAAISYKYNYFIDIGWYPEFDVSGSFKVFIGKDNWDDIRFEKEATLENIYDTIRIAINNVLQFIEEESDKLRE